ncbi:Uncharacterized protein HZ326_28246 [Fusarium oxysporum f. sp. albedinis]|nr:Uncharacterized protein HZ326_28246 [Fusarium oxysporum f. sp. albedinis]
MFDLGEISGPDTEPNAPGAVKRVHEIFSLPTFMKNVDGGDVKQGKLSNCWFVAGLTALANLEYGLTQACAAHDIVSFGSRRIAQPMKCPTDAMPILGTTRLGHYLSWAGPILCRNYHVQCPSHAAPSLPSCAMSILYFVVLLSYSFDKKQGPVSMSLINLL